MADQPHAPTAASAKHARQDRLKAALKENLLRRKAQARARAQDKTTASIRGASGDKDS